MLSASGLPCQSEKTRAQAQSQRKTLIGECERLTPARPLLSFCLTISTIGWVAENSMKNELMVCQVKVEQACAQLFVPVCVCVSE